MELWQFVIVPVVVVVAIAIIAIGIGSRALDGTSGDQRPEILRALADLVRAVRGRK